MTLKHEKLVIEGKRGGGLGTVGDKMGDDDTQGRKT